ncbi:hypothetical protein [Ornithinibacillus scapharcae]|uniref:hypothetical protein n=1 Tax=Ornithinibacillus scapharcae TaxID=1147159 RepID=UPI00110FAD6D|nr:hypothetical protein [Ornithinibacillus scapharcae]
MYAITPTSSQLYTYADIYYAMITLLFYLYAQVPYIRYIYNEHIGIENNLRNTIYQFLVNGFTVFLFSCIISIIATIGFALFLLPGLILFTIVFPIPYISVFDEKSVWKSYREGIRIGKKYFFKIILVIIGIGSIELLFGILVTFQLFNITSSFAAQIVTQMVLNLLVFPFIVMLMSSNILKWREEQEVLNFGNEEEAKDEMAG